MTCPFLLISEPMSGSMESEAVMIWGCMSEQPSEYYLYKHGGVELSYHRRVTERRGDIDMFTNSMVKVDGQIVFERDY